MDEQYTIGLVGPLPPPAGGMATQTRQLAQLLEKEGIDVNLLQTNKPYPGFVASIKGLRALFRLIPYLFAIWRLAGKAQIIHLMANSGWSWQLFAAPVIWIGRLRKTPVIVNYRGGYAAEYLQRSFARVEPTLKRASALVVPSTFLQQVFADFGIEATVVPNIINLEKFKPSPAATSTNKPVTLVITRNLEAIYGIDMAIRAVSEIRKTIPDVKLQIAGSGPEKANLENLVKVLALQDSVTFVGRLDASQIVDFYQSADIMLNPTTVDNMPNSVLEALACGIPVVSTNVGGIPHIVEHDKTALLVEANDHQAMANQVIRLCREPQLRQSLIENGLAAVRPYDWSVVREQWLCLYRSLVT